MKLTVNQPNIPEGVEIEIPGLGLFANGGTYEVPEDAVESATARGYTFHEDGVYGLPLTKKTKSAPQRATDASEDIE